MASATPANTLVVSMLATSMPIFGVYHAYKFDGWRCLAPRRKNLIRTSMVWCMILSGAFLSIWAITLCYLKYRLSFVILPAPYGSLPTPLPLWSKRDLHWIMICDVYIEEALYWIFLIRSVHRTREGRLKRIEQWASSRVFSIYLGLAIISTIAHVGVPFFVESDEEYRTIRIFVTEGVSAVFNVLMSIALAWYLPPFIRTVESRGGSKDVIRKLAFFEEMNTIRLFARAVFAAGTLSLGIDGLTTSKALMLNPFANDCLFMSLCLAFWLSMIVSIMLYLPVSYYKPDTEASGTTRREVTAEPVGEDTSALMSRHSKEHKALVTLLRERGTILEDEKVPEDALFYEMEDRTASWPKESRVGTEHDPELAQSQEQAPKSPRPTSQLPRALKRLSLSSPISSLPDAVTRFAGPFGGVPGEELPREVVIRVDQEVEVANQLGETYHSPRSLNRDPQPLRPGI